MVTFTSLPKHLAQRFMDEIEAGGIPVVMLRGDGQMNPDGVRDYDLLVPATVEALVVERHAATRERVRARGRWLARRAFIAEHGVIPPPSPPVRALLQRTTGARVRVDGEVVGEIGAGLVVLLGRRARRRRGRSPTTWRARRPSCASSATTRAGRTGRSLDIGGAALVVSQFTLYADTRRGRRPGFTGAASPELAERLYLRFADGAARARRDRRDGRFGAEMAVELVNDGPFTIWLDTADR